MSRGFSVSALAKNAFASLLYATGILHLWAKLAFRRRAVVLMYHRVLSPEQSAASWSHPTISVTPETFERHIRIVRRLFDVTSLDEYVERIESGKPFARPTCLITFDDGWRETRTVAWPILRKYGVPAVVFLPVNFIGGKGTFWQEQLGHDLFAVVNAARRDPSFARVANGVLASFGLERVLTASPEEVRSTISGLVRTRKYGGPEDITRLTNAVAALVPDAAREAAEIDRFMDWSDVREMSADGVAFGGHGADHWVLTSLAPEHAAEEIQKARQVLEHHLGHVLGFSYPNGDWNSGVADQVQRAGYRVAFTTMRGREGGRFAMKRVNVHEGATATGPMFLARLVGLF